MASTTSIPSLINNVNPNLTPASLYVGDLLPEVTETTLFELFNKVGPVASIRVCRDAINNYSLGYAYVNFHSHVDAGRAIDCVNFSLIKDRPCRIMWSQRDPSIRRSGKGNLFVGNLDKKIDNKTLYDTFLTFGPILSCKVVTDSEGNSLGYGFVHFENEEDAIKTVEQVNGTILASNKIKVEHFKHRTNRDGANRINFTNVYVKNFPPDFDESRFKSVFESIGEITSFMFPLDDDGKPIGFGFVNFADPKCAKKAIVDLNGTEPLNLYVCRAEKREERSKKLKMQNEAVRAKFAEQYAGLNLYVKNLDDSVGDEELKKEFEKFGEIGSVKVMRDSNQCSKGFGFVCFKKTEDAKKALAEMNNKLVAKKPLYVAMAQPKSVRQRQLQAQIQANNLKQMQQFGAVSPFSAPGLPQASTPQMFGSIPQMMYPQTSPGHFQRQQMSNLMFQNSGNQSASGNQNARWNPRNTLQNSGSQNPGINPNVYLMNQQYANNQGQQRQFQSSVNGLNPSMMYQQQRQMRPNKMNNGSGNMATTGGNVQSMRYKSSSLSSATSVEQKNLSSSSKSNEADAKKLIGERLYKLVHQYEPEFASKVTGMILDMDMNELMILLDNKPLLREKVNEAVVVIKSNGSVR